MNGQIISLTEVCERQSHHPENSYSDSREQYAFSDTLHHWGDINPGNGEQKNFTSLARLKLRMKLLDSHTHPDTSFNFLDHPLSMPVMGASLPEGSSINTPLSEQDLHNAISAGCKNAGTVDWRGGCSSCSVSTRSDTGSPVDMKGWGGKQIRLKSQRNLLHYFDQVEKSGAFAVCIDIHSSSSYMMASGGKQISGRGVEELKTLVQGTSLPVFFKGIIRVEDAIAAVDAGAAGIIVSNYSHRFYHHVPGIAEILPSLSAAVRRYSSSPMIILAEGGVRTGFDVLKMIALGADAVLVGHDLVRSASGGGARGVQRLMEYYQKTLKKALLMTGCSCLSEVSVNVLED